MEINQLNFVGIIPARYASSRFPGKPLALIAGKTMIERVYEQTSKALENVYVATDDQRIFDAVGSFGGKVLMTSDNHKSGTERCNDAYNKLEKSFDVVINIQGDEPFIQPGQIKELQNCFTDTQTEIATLVKRITDKDGPDFLKNPNHPKVVISRDNYAMYFSRSPIPYFRGKDKKEWLKSTAYYKHIGIYAYRVEVLRKITSLSPSPLETAESLEQLRWLENGYRIKVGFTDIESIGIDTPDDLEKVQALLK